METNRLKFVDIDESSGLQRDTPITGYMVVRSPRGTLTPKYYPANSRDRILKEIGAPNKTYPGIQELLDYNQSFSTWVSAPEGVQLEKTNLYGGVYLTDRASMEAFANVEDIENLNNKIVCTSRSTSSPYTAGSTLAVSGSGILIANIPVLYDGLVDAMIVQYPSLGSPGNTTSVTLSVDTSSGVINHISYLEGDPTPILTEVGLVDANSILIEGDVSIPELNFENTDLVNHLSLNLAQVSVRWTMDISDDIILAVFQNSARTFNTTFSLQKVDLTSLIEGTVNPLYGSAEISFSEKYYGEKTYNSPTLTLSTDYDAKDGFGNSIYAEDVIDGNSFIGVKVYKSFKTTKGGFTWGPVSRTSSGYRIISTTLTQGELDSSLLEGWSLISSDSRLSDVNLFMNVESTTAALATMASLRQVSHKFSTFISGLKVSSNDAATAITQLKLLSTPKMTGLAVYCNEFLIRENFSGTDFWAIPLGSVGKMLCNIMTQKLGGWAPMFTNTSQGIGGVLPGVNIKKQKYTFSADQLDELDRANINPIIFDIYYGVMMTSQKTCQSPQILTDWSFLGHQMAFDMFKKEIRTNVMIPQIGKPIDNFHMDLRKVQAEALLTRRLVGATSIWDSGKVEVQEVNSPETKMANKFIIKIRVKVNPFAEEVELVFNNIGQTSEV